jgi:hypothetical protein
MSHKTTIKYSAITLERVLNEFIKKSVQQASALQINKDKLLAIWKEMSRASSI